MLKYSLELQAYFNTPYRLGNSLYSINRLFIVRLDNKHVSFIAVPMLLSLWLYISVSDRISRTPDSSMERRLPHSSVLGLFFPEFPKLESNTTPDLVYTPVTPNSFSLFGKFLSNGLELCSDEMGVWPTFDNLFSNLMDRLGWEGFSRTNWTCSKFFAVYSVLSLDGVTTYWQWQWTHYKRQRCTSIIFETWSSRASIACAFAFYRLKLLILSQLQSIFQFCWLE